MYTEVLMQYVFSYTTEEFDELCFDFGTQRHEAQVRSVR